MTLAEQARAVRTREDLVAFLAALIADFDANREKWTNADLSSFLKAMAAWSSFADGRLP
jgi:hypothetical protein